MIQNFCGFSVVRKKNFFFFLWSVLDFSSCMGRHILVLTIKNSIMLSTLMKLHFSNI